MSVRDTSFRWCMWVSAAALLGVALFHALTYMRMSVVIAEAAIDPFYRQTIRALWLGYCLQALLLGLLFVVAAMRPAWISKPLLVICGLLPLAEAVLAFSFTGSYTAMLLLSCAALFVLLGAALWPQPVPVAAPRQPPPVTSATDPPR